ncbi:signal peptidase II [Anoxynatronum buryatiense]|uniref:Lipoprotein signal peptidase n=1 Tax=Anoxynatronum buryatiense TaxID=489973 RepID=A0AA45WU85_9CLOT|nr:signal peptidase II [Anoxynatronum buryatiense]SMP46822.1 signal peptidase II Aspartic peptidase. MEROPS family A08 [Anoxynatronum buryatiense]
MKWWVIVVTVVLDQVSKWLVVAYLKDIGTFPVIEGVFHLHYLENRGAAFGLLQNQRLFFIITTVLIVGGILWYLIFNPQVNRLLTLSLSLVVGGAIGNFIDRMMFGYVVDFFDFQFWPVFNIADSAIVIGQALLIYYIFKGQPEQQAGEAS